MARFTNPVIASSVRWTPEFFAAGMSFTGSGTTHPCYNSYYTKIGNLVSFYIQIDLSTVTNFGTGQFKTELPFTPHGTMANHFAAWTWVNPEIPPDEINGHTELIADNMPGSKTLDLHWLGLATPNPKPVIEHLFYQGHPVTLTTNSKIYVNGTYLAQE